MRPLNHPLFERSSERSDPAIVAFEGASQNQMFSHAGQRLTDGLESRGRLWMSSVVFEWRGELEVEVDGNVLWEFALSR
jgi:hypothetical protein